MGWRATCRFPSETVKDKVGRLWTSLSSLGGKEFCHIANWGLSLDGGSKERQDLFRHAVLIAHCLGRLAAPMENITNAPEYTFRGAGFDSKHRDFFEVGKIYRAPRVIPTTESRDTANCYARHAVRNGAEGIIWTIKVGPNHTSAAHVAQFTRRVERLLPEREWFFAAYSTFKVTRVRWAREGEGYHEIGLEAWDYSREFSSELPCAPWC